MRSKLKWKWHWEKKLLAALFCCNGIQQSHKGTRGSVISVELTSLIHSVKKLKICIELQVQTDLLLCRQWLHPYPAKKVLCCSLYLRVSTLVQSLQNSWTYSMSFQLNGERLGQKCDQVAKFLAGAICHPLNSRTQKDLSPDSLLKEM